MKIGFLATLVLVGIWSFSSPPGSSPDESFHIGNSWCAFGETQTCQISNFSTDYYPLWAEVPYSVDECLIPNDSTSTPCDEELVPRTQLVPIDSSNLYPSVYYKYANLVLRFGPEIGIPLLRFMNGVIAVLLFGIVLHLSRGQARLAIATMLLATLVPLGLFIIASVNPSSWSITGTSLSGVTLMMIRNSALRSPNSRSLLVLCFLVSLVLSSSRYDSICYSLAICVLVLAFEKKSRPSIRSSYFFPTLALIILILYFSRGLLSYLSQNLIDMFNHEEFFIFTRYWVIHFLEIPFTSIGLNYGLHGPTGFVTPPIVGHIQFGFLVIALACSMLESSLRQRAFFLIILLILFVLILQQVSTDRETGFYMVQGRYFLPFLAGGLGVTLMLSVSRTQLMLQDSIEQIVIFLVSIAHALTLFVFVRRYSEGFDLDYAYTEIDSPRNFALPAGWRLTQYVSPTFLIIAGGLAYYILAVSLFAFANAKNSQRLALDSHVQSIRRYFSRYIQRSGSPRQFD
jgi:hypothetical protein